MIKFDDREKVFLIETENTSYGIAIVDDKYVEHAYYGSKLKDMDIRYLLREDEAPFVPSVNKRETGAFCVPVVFPLVFSDEWL